MSLPTTVKMKQLLSFNRLFFSTNGASVLTLVIFQSINPRSRIGQFLFWPQNTLGILHLHPHNPLGARIMFLAFVTAFSVCIPLLLRLSRTKRWSNALLRTTPGIIAILGPMIGWLLAAPLDGIVLALLVTETAVWVVYTLYFMKRRRPRKVWEIILLLIVCFGFWVYLYRSYFDPVFLTVPLFGCLSYLAWASHISASRKMVAQGENLA